ncbi:MAG: archaeal heat shock protein Hsp20 [Desulfurococcaceae archaeon]
MVERRRRRRYSPFDEFFEELDEFMREMFEDIEKEFERLRKRGFYEEFKALEGEPRIYGPYVYGFRITIGPDGRPKIEEFGNVRRVGRRPIVSEEREPLVDVFEEKGEVVVIAELPGVDRDKISCIVSEDKKKLTIRASNEERKYYKEVDLPAPVDPESGKATYKNGVLEVRFKKVPSEEGKGYQLKVE